MWPSSPDSEKHPTTIIHTNPQPQDQSISPSSSNSDNAAGITNKDDESSTSIDTIHQDEAMLVLANYTGDRTWTPSEEKKLRRKIDWRLMPVLCFTYFLQYYDKAMLSQAALFSLRTSLSLDISNRYSMSASIFYLGFIAGAYPAMVLAQRYPLERVAGGIVTLWGICLMLTVVCEGYKGMYAQRFFLGMLESGISPMFMMVTGSWYAKGEQAFRMGIWFSCTGYALLVAPLINFGLGHIHSRTLSPWQPMYLFAGSLTILWGLLLPFLLPASPITASMLTPRERYLAIARLRSNNTGIRNTHLKPGQLIELLTDLKFWLLFSAAFLALIANGPISSFTPIIIKSFGFNTLNSLLLSMPAGAYVGTLQLLVPYLCYKFTDMRTLLIILCQLGTVLGALLLWLLPLSERGALLFACYILPSMGGGYAVLQGLQLANTAGYTKRAAASAGIYVGYCLGNFVGPLVMKAEEAPRYESGFLVVTVTSLAAAGLVLVYRGVCMWENRRRDRSGVAEGFGGAFVDDLTDRKNPQFRYLL